MRTISTYLARYHWNEQHLCQLVFIGLSSPTSTRHSNSRFRYTHRRHVHFQVVSRGKRTYGDLTIIHIHIHNFPSTRFAMSRFRFKGNEVPLREFVLLSNVYDYITSLNPRNVSLEMQFRVQSRPCKLGQLYSCMQQRCPIPPRRRATSRWSFRRRTSPWGARARRAAGG